MKIWQLVLSLFTVLLVAGLAIHHLGDTSPNRADSHLVSVAMDAMINNGHAAFLQGNGLNISPDQPFVSSQDATHAVVTIPYLNSSGPVMDPHVNLVLNPKTQDWQAVSFADGGGKTHPINWHP